MNLNRKILKQDGTVIANESDIRTLSDMLRFGLLVKLIYKGYTNFELRNENGDLFDSIGNGIVRYRKS